MHFFFKSLPRKIIIAFVGSAEWNWYFAIPPQSSIMFSIYSKKMLPQLNFFQTLVYRCAQCEGSVNIVRWYLSSSIYVALKMYCDCEVVFRTCRSQESNKGKPLKPQHIVLQCHRDDALIWSKVMNNIIEYNWNISYIIQLNK